MLNFDRSMIQRLVLTLVLSLISLFLVPAAVTDAQAERKCGKVTYTGESPFGPFPWTNQAAARNAAIQNWTGKATLNLPLAHGDWGKAKNKQIVCNKIPNGIGGFNHSCKARATPCWDDLD